MIHGASIGDRDQVLQSSIKLGFLTGFEDKVTSEELNMISIFTKALDHCFMAAILVIIIVLVPIDN